MPRLDHRVHQVTTHFPAPIKRWIVEMAQQHRTSQSQIIIAGIERMVAAHGGCGVEEVDEGVAAWFRARDIGKGEWDGGEQLGEGQVPVRLLVVGEGDAVEDDRRHRGRDVVHVPREEREDARDEVG